MWFQKNGDFMNKKLVEFIINSDIDSNIKKFIIESLAIEDDGHIRYVDEYKKLVNNYAGDHLWF